MTPTFYKNLFVNLILCTLLACGAAVINAQTSAFTYQGRLNDGATAATGTYDFQFKVFTAVTGGTQQGITVTKTAVPVISGIFTVQIDPSVSPFVSGDNRFLEISVRLNGSGAGYTTLTPRQQITSAPYSVQAVNSQYSTTLTGNFSGDVSGTQTATVVNSVGGQSAANVASATQLITSATSANTSNTLVRRDASGNFSAGTVNAATQFNIGDQRVLGVAGTDNLFLGLNAGISNTGTVNTFLGSNAGIDNSSGLYNTFVGGNTGLANQTGAGNAFFGAEAGKGNTTGGSNTFVGTYAGAANDTTSLNSIFGFNAGNKNRADANSLFGWRAGFSNTTGTRNSSFGANSGATNSVSNDNSFFGYYAGTNTIGGDNTFIGSKAGTATQNAANNVFVGSQAGSNNQTGASNTFLGSTTGTGNSTGFGNTFLGVAAGNANQTGNYNTTVGAGANVGSVNLTYATAVGAGAVVSNNNSVVLGRAADTVRVPGALNTTGDANINGNLTLGGSLNATNSTANFGLLIVDGNATVGGNLTVGYGNAQLKRILSRNAALTATIINPNAAISVTLPIAGAQVGDSVSLGVTNANNDLVFTPVITTDGEVKIIIRNLSSSPLNFPSQLIRATVIGF